MNDEQNKDFEEMQKSLKELEDIISKTNFSDIKDINNNITKVYAIYEKFPESKEIASEYVRTLDALAKSQESLVDLKAIVAKASVTYEKFPESEVVASVYVYTLSILARVQDSLADVKPMVAEASGIYETFPDSEAVAYAYVHTLITLAKSQESLKATVAKASSIYETFPDSEAVASEYVSTLSTLASRQESLDDLKATVAKASSIYKTFPDSEAVAYAYVRTLSTLASRQESLDDLKATVAKVSGVYETFPNSEAVACVYVLILEILAGSQEKLDDLKATVAKVSGIYETFPDSEDVAFQYVLTLSTLASRQESLDDLKATVAKASSIYKTFPDSVGVAYLYAKTLVYLESRQETTQNLQETFTKVIDIYNSFTKKEYISSLFAEVISEYINNINFNIPNEQNESAEERLTILFNCIGNDNYELTEYIIDNIFYSNNDSISLSKDIVLVLREIFNVVIKLDYLKQTKYAILIELLKDLEDDNREQLIKIYWIVQKIKYELSIKDLSKNKFGHYTSGDVLQILLKQSSDNEGKYSIEGRTRLGNVKYMNDPEEGSVLDRYMELGKSDNLEVSLKPSPWFLMSLTTKIDDLAMWSQYGARAEGVCLVLKTDSFKVYKSMAETEWIGNFDISILEKKLTSIKREETNSSNKKDYLYRICYLDEESLNNGDSNVVKEDNNNLLDDEEIKSINTSLVELKQFLNNIAKDSLLNNAIEECLEEIRYLFKVSGYSYESELRILKYAMLDLDNEDIKIDDKSGPVAKLYLERAMPIQLEQVIFGPKFSNPEHVVPLLHFLDKGIELRRSERKFK